MNGTPAWVPIFAAILGAIAGGGLKAFLDRKDRLREDESILVAIASEVSALCQLIRFQDYAGDVEKVLIELRANPDSVTSYVVDFRSDYFTVYHALASKLGRLSPHAASKIVSFYSNCKTVIDCTRPDGVAAQISSNAEATESFEIAYALIQQVLSLGDEIVQMPKSPLPGHPLK